MDWLERTAKLRQWTRSGTRAPHKPLLFLYALGRFQEDEEGGLRYSAVELDLQRLLTEYGPPNKTTPAYPFHHLVSDGVWEVRTDRGPGSPGSGVRDLRETGATGRLAPDLRAALRREPQLLGRLTRLLLDLHFPPSLHAELCEAVGLDLEPAESEQLSPARRQRDRRMRELVLTAYEYRCGHGQRQGTTVDSGQHPHHGRCRLPKTGGSRSIAPGRPAGTRPGPRGEIRPHRGGQHPGAVPHLPAAGSAPRGPQPCRAGTGHGTRSLVPRGGGPGADSHV
ncbi:restriction endonuclease [Streptomyces spinoverrucosus]|uniref:restriction endonuclease n=1 Tax=Streptomyces spinoverrucosus TaxID=284043 RepID=UPI0035AEA188